MSSWKTFNHRNLWQHALWDKFQTAIGRKTFHLEVLGAMALVVKHPLPLGLSWLEVPRGPLFEDGNALELILEKIKTLGIKEKSVFVRLSPYQEMKIENLKLNIAEGDKHPETSLIVDLTQSEDEILAKMKPKGRYYIKVAKKHGVQVQVSDKVGDFYSILQATSKRDGFFIHSQSYYEKMVETLGEHVQLLVAVHEGRIIAGGIFIYLDEWGIYYYGALNHEYRKYMSPYLVQWEAMLEAKKRGCRYYDFLGISPENAQNHAWAGVTDFKKKFGGEVRNYPQAKEIVLRPFWYWLYKLRKSL